ncbi:MAG: endonuclease [Nitrospinae bacterium CG11_big_fil_rev_8_21_14_0_20_56_8]|nr:MAG: endonuclease [Nitrospinae bacterium CG11_big_fil_rev_8_21_14_0_20_56_8]
MTYNVHTCRGMDGKLAPDRIARVIAHYDPDIVALQELDVRRLRTRQLDQAHYLARFLEMEYHFYPALRVAGEQYGDAILSRFPMRLVKSGPLPGLPDHPRLEPRGALWISLTVGEEEIQVINTHLGLKKRERQAQVEALLGPEWLGHPDCRAPVILCGDFNFTPHSREFRKICHHYPDAQAALKDHRPQRTFTGRFPLGRIDHIFLDNTIRIYSVEVPRTAVTRVASDHLPLIAEIDIPRKTEITAAPPPP